jgi:hypothetical protein
MTTLIAAGLALGACSSSASAAKDVTVTACTNPAGGHPTATGQILNHSSRSSVYTVHVEFTDASGNGVGDGIAAVAKVDPRTSATWHATGTLSAKGSLQCKIASVTRHALP